MSRFLLKNTLALQRVLTGGLAAGVPPYRAAVGAVRCWQSLRQQQRRDQSSSKTPASFKTLEMGTINPGYTTIEYAVRGPILLRAIEIEKELAKGAKKNFKALTYANIGDPQGLGQKPFTFFRQILACCVQPTLLDSPQYPNDVKERAKALLAACKYGSIGSYSHSNGLELVRQQIAKYIESRDGVPSHADWIYIFSGATYAIKCILQLHCCIEGKKSGIMTPVPQYPLYSCTCSEFGLHRIDYYLDEENQWGLDICELQRAYDEAKSVCNPRALVVINPGNPSGSVLTCENMIEVVKFVHKNKLLLLADEVYQGNVYDDNYPFKSFKKLTHEMGDPYKSMELISFNTASKGPYGECGLRGGYMELVNIDNDVRQTINKYMTTNLCSTVAGQVMLSCVATQPQSGEPSYNQFEEEKNNTMCGLKERAKMVYEVFNCYEGFKVNKMLGAMCAFVKFDLPPKAIEAAKAKKVTPDQFYCFELLESAGIVTVPGSGFGQIPGTHHLRTTILQPTEEFKDMLERFHKFHEEFLKKYK